MTLIGVRDSNESITNRAREMDMRNTARLVQDRLGETRPGTKRLGGEGMNLDQV
jgi:hypothetical protein